MYERDVVYCDAGFFEKNHTAIIGILYKKEVTRIKARAKNTAIAELLAILMARKLYPGKMIVNDCLSVVRTLNTDISIEPNIRQETIEKRKRNLFRWVGDSAEFLLSDPNLRNVVWQKRRTDDETCMVDSLTRKHLTKNFQWRLRQDKFNLKEFNF